MRASTMFKLAAVGWIVATFSVALLFAGFAEAEPFVFIGFLLGAGSIGAGAIAHMVGELKNDLKEKDEDGSD